jgi:CBS domain-containing protein
MQVRAGDDLVFVARNVNDLSANLVIMAEKDIGSVIVMEKGDLVGILTFREVINTFHLNKGFSVEGRVRAHMNDRLVTVTSEMDVKEASQIMLEKHARYLPVMDAKVLSGVISFYDVAKAMLEAQHYENKMLKAYIQDWPVAVDE